MIKNNMKKYSLISLLVYFLRKQKILDDNTTFTTKEKILGTLRTTFLTYPLSIIGAIISYFFTSILISKGAQEVTTPDLGLPSIVQILLTVYLGIIFAPIVEEIVFRGWLKLKFRYVFSLIGYLCYQVLISILGKTAPEIFDGLPDKGIILQSAIIPFGFITLGYLIGKFLETAKFTKDMNSKIENFGENKSRLLVITSILVFAWIHGGNILSFSEFWFLAPLFTLSQLVGGFTFAFIRLRYGLKYSMLSHSIENAIFSIPAFFLPFLSDGLVNGTSESLTVSDIAISAFIVVFYIVIVISILINFIYSIIEHSKLKAKLAK